jgi:NAD(P)-dependent dehydrogenase (short-subunit alcohol dehydrogenase family)
VAPFLLTHLLRPNVTAADHGRVITTSSSAHTTGRLDRPFDPHAKWSSWGAYGDSKLANIAFTTELDRRFAGTNATANCFHPGVVHTGFGRDKGLISMFQNTLGKLVLLSPEKGADTLVFLASSDEALTTHGKFWVKRQVKNPSTAGRDATAASLLWTQTAALVAKYTN